MAKAFVTGVGGVEKQSVELKVSQNGKYRIVPDTGIVFDEVSAEVDVGSIRMLVVTELPTENIEKDVIYLLPSGNSEEGNVYDEYVYTNGAWEKIGGGGISVDLTDYVKNTDVATTSLGSSPTGGKLGLTRYLAPVYGGLTIDENGCVKIYKASDPKFMRAAYTCQPITAECLNVFLIEALAGDTYQLSLTEEEKAAALECLGAVPKQKGEPDSGATRGFAYGLTPDGETAQLYRLQIQSNAGTVPIRNALGNFYVSDPTLIYETANKNYVDNSIAAHETAINEALSAQDEVIGDAVDQAAAAQQNAQEALNTANDLKSRADSGEFKGDPGDKGDAYVLTDTDKAEIVSAVLANFTDVSEVAL